MGPNTNNTRAYSRSGRLDRIAVGEYTRQIVDHNRLRPNPDYPVIPRPDLRVGRQRFELDRYVMNRDSICEFWEHKHEEHPEYWESDLIRMNDLILITDLMTDKFETRFFRHIEENTIVIPSLLNSFATHKALSDFSFAAMALLYNIDLKGKRVIDLGSGDGLLSLAALKLGADQAVMFEINEKLMATAAVNMEANRYVEDFDFFISDHDISDRAAVASFMSRFEEDPKDAVVISNLGNWSNYNVTNRTSMGLIKPLEEVMNADVYAFIGGGYTSEQERVSYARSDMEALKKEKFLIYPDISRFGTDMFYKFAWLGVRRSGTDSRTIDYIYSNKPSF